MSRAKAKAERVDKDAYETPRPYADQIVAALDWENIGTVLEPTAGSGRIVRAIVDAQPAPSVLANEIRPECGPDLGRATWGRGNYIIGDYRGIPARGGKYDRVITNPPFSDIMGVLQMGLQVARVDVILLVPIGFLFTAKRYEFHRQRAPHEIFFCSSRPSFVGGGNDYVDYVWARYVVNFPPRPPIVHWLEPISRRDYPPEGGVNV